jgi:actin-like ATPase involved in cell morphogenesis
MKGSDRGPQLGIDFGTTFCSMSWFDAKNNEARIIPNLEGEFKTPSVVYYGPDGAVSIGAAAQNEFIDALSLGETEAAARLVCSIKRNLLRPPVISLPGGRAVRPVEVVAEIIGKLKRDAEEGHFHEKIARATVTVPAAFDADQRGVIETGARRAGFQEVNLLEEPVAAAMAFAREGQKVGNNILVYDLGGGTFDLAILSRQKDGQFEVALPPAGDPNCGGDDFDLALYNYCEKQLGEQEGHGFSNGDGKLDVAFLLECRRGKEVLSRLPKVVLHRLSGGRSWQYTVTREVLEGLIAGQVQRTMRMAEGLLRKAHPTGCKADTVVLVGGSARIPMVYEGLKEVLARAELEGEPLKYANQDVAVALGASYDVAHCSAASALHSVGHKTATIAQSETHNEVEVSLAYAGTDVVSDAKVDVLFDGLWLGQGRLKTGFRFAIQTNVGRHYLEIQRFNNRDFELDFMSPGKYEVLFTYSTFSAKFAKRMRCLQDLAEAQCPAIRPFGPQAPAIVQVGTPAEVEVAIIYPGTHVLSDAEICVKFDGMVIGRGCIKRAFRITVHTAAGQHSLETQGLREKRYELDLSGPGRYEIHLAYSKFYANFAEIRVFQLHPACNQKPLE